jgi:hypothetical protein
LGASGAFACGQGPSGDAAQSGAASTEAEGAADPGSSEGAGATAAGFVVGAQPTDPPAPQLLAADVLAKYKTALPRITFAGLQRIFESPGTLWYDKVAMVPSYQDSVGDGVQTPIGARANSQGRDAISVIPRGRRFFSEDGKTWSFPFAHTAGTDKATNLTVVNFLWLPVVNGKRLPVVYRTINDPNGMGGLGLRKWTWMFPKGTVVGEILFLTDSAGALTACEVRTRSRYLDGWGTNVFRPYPTAASLSAAIKEKRANWAQTPTLAAMVSHLENPGTLQAASADSPAYNNVFQVTGALDPLPPFQDPALVKELLAKPFVPAYGLAWKASGNQRAFAPTTQEAFSIVPNGYEAGLLEVNERACTKCHDQAGRAINDFESTAVLYGDIWGEDQVFSFHPYDQTQYGNFNTENRRVRPEFATSGYVVAYDPNQHPATVYKAIPTNR